MSGIKTPTKRLDDEQLLNNMFVALKEGHRFSITNHCTINGIIFETVQRKRIESVLEKFTKPYEEIGFSGIILNGDGRQMIDIHGSYKNFLINERKKYSMNIWNKIPIYVAIFSVTTTVVLFVIKESKSDSITIKNAIIRLNDSSIQSLSKAVDIYSNLLKRNR